MLLLAACSGDDGDSAALTTTTEAAATTTSDAPRFTGDAGSAFCALLRDVDTASILAGDPEDPSSVEAAFGRLTGLLGEAAGLAPPEIAADVTLVRDGVAALDAALAAVDYDFDALAASGRAGEVTAAVNDPAFATAGARLNAYRTQVCRL